ncbi:hypothetical protein BDA99DRAFT_538224 [Phascolomyces articulosus]|uniref:Uncharacterized protein n=1 Tax=Phascolomyces articulosus TaxID=60185 RepID=A0AAD5K831_9FUNG|nr:hypothetical protein BDA99DRAFT_538224 [Phascolomyces articulosus]
MFERLENLQQWVEILGDHSRQTRQGMVVFVEAMRGTDSCLIKELCLRGFSTITNQVLNVLGQTNNLTSQRIENNSHITDHGINEFINSYKNNNIEVFEFQGVCSDNPAASNVPLFFLILEVFSKASFPFSYYHSPHAQLHYFYNKLKLFSVVTWI